MKRCCWRTGVVEVDGPWIGVVGVQQVERSKLKMLLLLQGLWLPALQCDLDCTYR